MMVGQYIRCVGHIIHTHNKPFEPYYKIYNWHQNYFIDGILKYSPCDIFEIVSGIKIHTDNVTIHDLNNPVEVSKWENKYEEDYKKFLSLSIGNIRN